MAYQIVTDSCCNLPEALIDELGIEVLPLVFMIDGKQHQSYLNDARRQGYYHLSTQLGGCRKNV